MSTSNIPDRTTEWVLDPGEETELGIDGVLADGIGGRTRGETYDYTLVFRDANRWPGEARAVECFNSVLDRGSYAGAYDTHEMIDGSWRYTPAWPTDSDSLLVNLEPVDAWASPIPGLWGLLDTVEPDEAPITGKDDTSYSATVAVSITYLADSREYTGREALRDDFEKPGLF